jgi:F420-non-reducing hydrogenase small subunit
MSDKISIAVSWAAACGGCDVSLLDMEGELLGLLDIADIVYWPVAMDYKRAEFLARPEGSVDIGLFNGAVRTTEQEEDARAFREKCKVLVAYGSCAAFGGIPGLGNFSSREEILQVAYEDTPSTVNEDGLRPSPTSREGGRELTLPELSESVRSLAQVVAVDAVLPGCPPPAERIRDLIAVAADYAKDGRIPLPGTVLAPEAALCEECPRRETRKEGRMSRVVRPHEVLADPELCFLEQGMLCLGLATRAGCGATCIAANAPCRGCFGPAPGLLDPATEAVSAIASLTGEADENDLQAHERMRAVRGIRDPAGTFYRYTLPSSFLHRVVDDRPRKEES